MFKIQLKHYTIKSYVVKKKNTQIIYYITFDNVKKLIFIFG